MKKLMVCLVVLAGCGSSATQGVSDDNPDAMTSEADAHIDGDNVDAMPDGGPQTCTADTQNDPSNCGLCGRSCLGGTCSMGRCEAVPLTPGDASGIGDFTTDGLFLYYSGFTSGTSANHRLWRIAIGPTTGAEYIGVFGYSEPLSEVAFDGSYFYAVEPYSLNGSDYGRVKKVSKSPFGGGDIVNLQPATTTAVFQQNGYVYWAADLNTNAGEIKRIPAAGGTIDTITVVAGVVHYLAGDSTNLYWVDNGGGGLAAALRRAPIGGGTTIEVTSGVADYLDMDATRIYMVRKNTGELISVAKTGGTPAVIGTGITAGGAVDDEYVYAAKANQLVAVTKTGVSMGVLWERSPDGTPQCPTVMKITRTKVIGDYVYFLVVPTTCNNVKLYNIIYRLPRL